MLISFRQWHHIKAIPIVQDIAHNSLLFQKSLGTSLQTHFLQTQCWQTDRKGQSVFSVEDGHCCNPTGICVTACPLISLEKGLKNFADDAKVPRMIQMSTDLEKLHNITDSK